jgi:hypothetical protein
MGHLLYKVTIESEGKPLIISFWGGFETASATMLNEHH